MSRKIGIVTLVDNLNYGNRLQNYAVDSIYKRLGAQPVTLVNDVVPPVVKAKRLVKRLLGRPEEQPCPEKDPRYQLFEKFNAPIEFRHVRRWHGLADEFDFFSTGSDQIWNPYYSLDLRWPFLEFARREQRVALCPSIGIGSIPDEYAKDFSRGALGFDKLSVRERAGKEILDGLGCTESVVLADPTVMVEPEEWLRASNDSIVPSEPYVFVYALGESDEGRRRFIQNLAQGRKVVSLSDHSNEGGVLAGPAEFIGLIAHANAVVTDSFHGSVFSMLLDTPLTIVKRLGSGSDLSSRIDTFVEKFGLERALFENGGNAVLSAEEKKARLDCERSKYLSFLSRLFEDEAVSNLAGSLGLHASAHEARRDG